MKLVALFIIAYLLGSIPAGVWIGKLFFKKDIRTFGSGNTGTTNTFRVLGKKAGMAVFAIDLLKGTLATCLPLLAHVDNIDPLWFGLAAIVGHTFPIFAGFKGGKAVATSAGMLLGYSPTFFLYCAVIFFTILYISSMVSLTSMLSAALITVSTIIVPKVAPGILHTQSWLFTIILTALTIFIVYRHRENIQRIMAGNENRVSFGLNKQDKEVQK